MPDNFLVREDGTVTLIDFVEDPEAGLNVFINTALASWGNKVKNYGWNRAQTEEFFIEILKDFKLPEFDINETIQMHLKEIFGFVVKPSQS